MSNGNDKRQRFLLIAGDSFSLLNLRGSLIKKLVELGIEVHVAAPQLHSDLTILATLKNWGVSCHELKFKRAGLNPISDLNGVFFLFRLMRSVQPTWVLSYTIKPVIYGMISAWLASIPHRFALIPGLGYAFTGKAKGKRRLIQLLARILYSSSLRKAEGVIFQNSDDERLFRTSKIIPQKLSSIVVNGSGVDLKKFDYTAPGTGVLEFLFVGRLLGDKGVREYVKAAQLVRKKYPNVVFRLAGPLDDNPDSIEVAELNSWIDCKAVDYLGKLSDVRFAIKNCSVFVLPSYREGTPRSVLEAMAMGRAIITTDAPGCRETVVNGLNGFLVPIKSDVELAVAMEKFIQDRELIQLMGSNSRKIACEKFDVHKVNEVMLNYMRIID